MKLKIIEYIEKNGLASAIKTFKLSCKVYENKILLKYSQIDSPMGVREVQECRGLILEKDTWKIMNCPFFKFFNSEETYAAKIDWDSAKILVKKDGSLISLYFDWNKNEWCVSTSGMAEGEGEVNNTLNTNFSTLFWTTMKKYSDVDEFKSKLKIGYSYMFELMTPYNIVVTPHKESTVNLLAIRDLNTLDELPYEEVKNIGDSILHIPVVEALDLTIKNVTNIKRQFDGMPFYEEGYVVVDKFFNRIKIKNPAYLAAHHLKNKTGFHHIMDVVKSNEIEEFSSTFPERKEELFSLYANYKLLISKLEMVWEELKMFLPKNISPEERKKFAGKVFEISTKYDVTNFNGLFFLLKDQKATSIPDFIYNYDNRRLYEFLKK